MCIRDRVIADTKIEGAKGATHDTLRAFTLLGASLIEARGDGTTLEEAVLAAGGWGTRQGLVLSLIHI